MPRGAVTPLDAWPRLMRAAIAAAYVGEHSVDSFRRSVGKLWPAPHRISGKGERWLRDELDQAIDRLTGHIPAEGAADLDAADLL